MRLLIATDAWEPQINGVVQTLVSTRRELDRRGHETLIAHPGLFRSAPLPGYGEIRLAWPESARLRAMLESFRPDHVHIATEGPVGWSMRRLRLRQRCGFTTSYHTRFPEYLAARLPVPVSLSYALLRRFHNAGQGVMVATQAIERDLSVRGFLRTTRWSRGVDLDAFRADAAVDPRSDAWARPIFLSVGRLAPEKNLHAFLSLKLPGTKVVVGDGPSGPELRARYPDAVFLGAVDHAALPALYAAADVFVFPSRTDTFGLVLIEAMACGLPVAAFPGPGPDDVVGASGAGILSDDLSAAALGALRIDRNICRRHAEAFTWREATDQFLANLESARDEPTDTAA